MATFVVKMEDRVLAVLQAEGIRRYAGVPDEELIVRAIADYPTFRVGEIIYEDITVIKIS